MAFPSQHSIGQNGDAKTNWGMEQGTLYQTGLSILKGRPAARGTFGFFDNEDWHAFPG
jgi:hypothetical protein